MSFPDITEDLQNKMPDLRGRLRSNAPLAEYTWFRVGGPTQILFNPADEHDLSYFLQNCPSDIPITFIGLGSNIIIRDGGVPGVVIRLGKGFHHIIHENETHLRVGAGVPDVKVARAAAEYALDGFAFLRGIPGAIGGALRMNAGAHGAETKDIFVSATAIDRAGQIHVLNKEQMGFAYRYSAIPNDWIFTECVLQGTPGDQDSIYQQMQEVADYREQNQPIKSRTGGSTFKNPPGISAWKLIDAAGCRGLKIGQAQVSEMHCNFLLNLGGATAHDLEALGETVREKVRAQCGVELQWEIKRLGRN